MFINCKKQLTYFFILKTPYSFVSRPNAFIVDKITLLKYRTIKLLEQICFNANIVLILSIFESIG